MCTGYGITHRGVTCTELYDNDNLRSSSNILSNYEVGYGVTSIDGPMYYNVGNDNEMYVSLYLTRIVLSNYVSLGVWVNLNITKGMSGYDRKYGYIMYCNIMAELAT